MPPYPRYADGGAFVQIDTAPADSVQRWVAHLSSASAYRFRVAAFSPRNTTGYSNTLGIRSVVQNFERIYSITPTPGAREVYSLAFSPDGKMLAGGGTFDIDLWSAGDGTQRGVLQNPTGSWMRTIVYAPGGTMLAAARAVCADLWDPVTGQLIRSLSPDASGGLACVSFDPTGNILVCGTGSGITLSDTRTGSLLRRIDDSRLLQIARMSPDGGTIAAGGNPITLYRTIDGSIAGSIAGQNSVAQIAYSPDGNTIAASSSQDLTVRLWSAGTGALLHELSGRTHGWSIAFSPDGRWVAAGDWLLAPPPGEETSGEATMWNVNDGSVVTTFPGNSHTSGVAFNPFGNLIAVGMSGRVDVWAVKGTWVPSP